MDGPAPTSSAKKGGRIKLTREERSKIRILSDHGLSGPQISEQSKRSFAAVYNVLNGRSGADDDGDDYDFVSKEFKEQFPPLQKAHKRRKTDHNVTQSASTHEEEGRRERRSPSTDGSLTVAIQSRPSSTKEVNRSKDSSGVRNAARPVASSSRQRAGLVIVLDPDIKPDTEVKPSALPTMDKFLASLDHDLTVIKGALEEQDLGTTEKLFAIAHWPDDELHKVLREGLPMLTVAQRYMLIKGMKKYDVVTHCSRK
ncbi:hypothetical protein LshimejAT787_0113000 [Lyophyllum shimeji]|uniref:Uncharacterized protein n=1 Tax=Lyophyllum shimeji TaxID=47721 RepID=A0A9P3PEI9_LYOSH|nr:hypothetical protein LshimejAT787_0113000 [Lyophyllum shimeji]